VLQRNEKTETMRYFSKHIKYIAYFLTMLILCQSCVAYNNYSSTIEEASSEKEMPVKIVTKDGNEYKLSWVEEKDDNIVSIKFTKREYYNKKDITQYVILDPEPRVVPFDQALKHHGAIRLLIRDDKDRYNSHQFIRIGENEEIITGYKMTGYDTLTVIIPIDQIETIQLKDKDKSSDRTAGLVVGVALGVGIIILGAVIASDLSDGWFSQ